MDHRSDIFAAGTLLYVLLTGVHPFRADTDVGTMERVRLAAAPPPRSVVPGIPAALEAICQKAMSLSTEDRYQDAGQMERALEAYRVDNPFNRRHLARWMKDNFVDELDHSAALLHQAEMGTTTDHTPSDGARTFEEDQDETSIFALYPPPADLFTGTLQTPSSPVARDPVVPEPLAGAAVPTRRKSGRALVVVLGLVALALAAIAMYVTVLEPAVGGGDSGDHFVAEPAAGGKDQGSLAGKERPGRPALSALPGQTAGAVDAGVNSPDLPYPQAEPLAPMDAGKEIDNSAESPRTSIAETRRPPQRRTGRRRRRRKKMRRRHKPRPPSPPDNKRAPVTKPGVAPLPYPTL